MADPKNYPFIWKKCSKEEQEGNTNHNYFKLYGHWTNTLFTNYFFRI